MMTTEELQEAFDNTPQEYWDERIKAMNDTQKEMDDKCTAGDHQGILSNPHFAGADIYWQCSRCHRRVSQRGGNLPMSI